MGTAIRVWGTVARTRNSGRELIAGLAGYRDRGVAPPGGKDPGSVALRDSLGKHHRILVSDSAYPLQDPYTETRFPQRQTDTLFALDASRRQL